MNKTVYDVIGIFQKQERTDRGVRSSKVRIKLREGLDINDVVQFGSKGLETEADKQAFRHSRRNNEVKQWMLDWELEERQVEVA